MNETARFPASPPLVIGATGGSGTRVVARIARHAGYYLGTHLNPAEDALEFVEFYDTWVDYFLDQYRSPATSTAPQLALDKDFSDVLQRHLAGFDATRRDTLWGWKSPRSIYLLPYFHAKFPDLKFIHVLRDGRDMALSKNQNQLRKHGRRVLAWRERWFVPTAVRSILLWDRINRRAAEYAEKELRDCYLRIRFEDLCLDPVNTTGVILRFLGQSTDPAPIAHAEISPPSTLGRWREKPGAMTSRLERVAGLSLRKFGYLAREA